MQTIADKIYAALDAKFKPLALLVIDDSAQHAGHAGAQPGGQTHYTVRMTASAFAGMSRVARHRAVYAEVELLFSQGLHALAIDAKTPGER